MNEEDFKLKVVSTLAEVVANQKNLESKLDTHILSNNQRLDNLEHTVNGNGSSGIAEDVRNIKGRWALLYGIGILFISGIAEALAFHYIH
jgi:hypothetical protein